MLKGLQLVNAVLQAIADLSKCMLPCSESVSATVQCDSVPLVSNCTGRLDAAGQRDISTLMKCSISRELPRASGVLSEDRVTRPCSSPSRQRACSSAAVFTSATRLTQTRRQLADAPRTRGFLQNHVSHNISTHQSTHGNIAQNSIDCQARHTSGPACAHLCFAYGRSILIMPAASKESQQAFKTSCAASRTNFLSFETDFNSS
jgi:hypothetical protein